MTDYVAIVRGVLPNGQSWSTSRHITSNQTEASLLTTWENAWTSAWNLAVTGLATVYTAGTTITGFEVGSLDGSMRKVSHSLASASLAGSNGTTAGAQNTSVVIYWGSAGTLRNQRGRQKLPAPAQDQATDGVLGGTPANNIKAAMDSIATAVRSDGSTYFVFPRYETETGIPPFTKTVLIGNALVRNQLGTEAKRERKVVKTYT